MKGLSGGCERTESGRDPVRNGHSAQRLRYAAGGLTAAAAILAAHPALAAGGEPAAASDTIFVAELGLLLLVGRLMGELAQRLGQPPVMGQLVGGLLLGPSFFGLVWPAAQHALFPHDAAQHAMIEAVSQLGILMLLLLTGMETDLQLVRRVGRAAVTVAAAGVTVPFLCGFALGEWMPAALLPNPDARLVTAIFLGTALSISSVKIVAMVVRDMNFMRRDIGQIIVASAILEDTIGWVIIAIAFGLATAGRIDPWSVGRAVIGTVLFLAASFTLGRRTVFSLIRWANDSFKSEFAVVTAILLVMVAMALVTQAIGVNTVLGAFVAGILIGESPILTRHIEAQLRGLITALFMPVFFGLAGSSADLTVLRHGELAWLAVGLVLIASLGKFSGAFIGGKLGGLSRAESLALGCGMNARGSTEVIVASIGLSAGVLNQNLFTLIVTMAVLTTLAMPTQLRWALKRLPLRKKERLRLEREALDAKGFVVNLERLLLAADDSANGRIAARLAGAIAGSGGKPTTILDLAADRTDSKANNKSDSKAANPKEKPKAGKSDAHRPPTRIPAAALPAQSEHVVKAAAEDTVTLETHPDEEQAGSVDVIVRQPEAITPDAIAGESRKGYDLLVVGIAKTHNPKGGFSKDVARLTAGFAGPLALVDAEPADAEDADGQYGRILIPINGTEMSRRAVEVGLALARSNDARVTALYVTRDLTRTNGKDGRRSASRRRASRRTEQAVLKDVDALAERYAVDLRSTTRVDLAPDQAILREAKRGYDLIVLGVTRRPGDTLFFGNTAEAVLDHAPTAKLFVAS